MGTVWRARDRLLHRIVAVKEVRPADPDPRTTGYVLASPQGKVLKVVPADG